MADPPPPAGAGVSLSFAKPARPRVKVAEADEPSVRRELITGVQGGVLEPVEPRPSGGDAGAGPSSAPRVIPALPNSFQVGGGGRAGDRKYNPDRYIPEPAAATAGDGADRFEAAGAEEAQTGVAQYGLQKREGGRAAAPPPAAADRPSASLSVATRQWEAARYKEDVASLPDAPPVEAYEATPVEAFGEALLRGMGWTGARADPVPDAVRRPALLGLGAQAAPPRTGDRRRPRKPGDPDPAAAPPPPPPPVPAGGSGAPTITVGARVRVTGGRHRGLDATVLSVDAAPRADGRPPRARVALLPSEAEASVDVRDLKVATKRTSDRRRSRSREREERKRGRDDRDRGDRGRDRRDRPRSPSPTPPPPTTTPWLHPGIVVRVVSKRVGGGALYLRRATVVDVPTPATATLAPHPPSDGRSVPATVVGVPQSALETALPRGEGGRVLIVRGAHRGRSGSLLARGERGAAVQLGGDMEVVKVGLDDVAAYVGEDE